MISTKFRSLSLYREFCNTAKNNFSVLTYGSTNGGRAFAAAILVMLV